ncbi:Glutamine amidotransferase-like class 1 domain-containing protein 1, partial [Quaeritorhiza haematococci]
MSTSVQQRKILFLLTPTPPGVNAKTFIQAFTVCSSVFKVAFASVNGQSPMFSECDDGCNRWFQDKKHEAVRQPLNLDTLDLENGNYVGLVVPDGNGFLFERPNHSISRLLDHFMIAKSTAFV